MNKHSLPTHADGREYQADDTQTVMAIAARLADDGSAIGESVFLWLLRKSRRENGVGSIG